MPRRLLAYATPDQISGLVCWLKADALSAANDDALASWDDSSGNSNTPTQATGAAKPTFKTNIINGLPAVFFDGGDRLAMPTEGNFDLATPTIFVVFKRTSGTSGTVMSKNTTGSTTGQRRKMQISTTGSGISYASGSDSQGINVSATMSQFNMFGVSATSDSLHSIYLNGVQTDSTAALADSTVNNAAMEIGAAFSNGAEAFIGYIAEIIVYNVPLSGIDVIGLQNYLANKYSLTVADSLGGFPRNAISSRTLIPTAAGLRFDGIDDYGDLGSLGSFGSSLNNDGLCAFSFRMLTASTSHGGILGTSNGGLNTTLFIGINRNSSGTTTANKMGVFIRNNSNVYQNVGTTNTFSLADSVLHHYVVQRVSRYVWEIWQDGVSLTMSNPSASGDLTVGFTNFSNPVAIGASGGSSFSNFASLDLSELLIYQRALTSDEIAALYAGTIATGPFRQFNLTQNGQIAIDLSANAINGVISGATLVSPRTYVGGGSS